MNAWTCRTFHFAASHRLANPQFTEQQNRDFYGKCTNPNGHGHNFFLEVAVGGDMDPTLGKVVADKELDKIVEKNVVELFDHKNFNFDIPQLTGTVTTGENITKVIWKILNPLLPPKTLKRLRLTMSPPNRFEYYGEDE